MKTGYEINITPQYIRYLYRRLVLAGYGKKEAGNLIAKLMGMAAVRNGWTPQQLQNMLFLEYLDKKKEKV